jgi:cell division protein FtsI (penicillin-binding protein 3)
MEKTRRKRAIALCALGAACFFLLIGRLVMIQVARHDYYLEAADKQHKDRIELEPRRGAIFDRNGELLAKSITTQSLCADVEQVKNRQRTAARLSEAIGLPKESFLTSMSGRKGFVWLERQIKSVILISDMAAGIPGVSVRAEQSRSYPLREAASHIVGIVDRDGRGLEGVEKEFNQVLRGEPGWATIVRDATGERYLLLDGYKKPPRDGASVTLSVDGRLQSIAASRLHKTVERLDAKGGCVVMVDPRTGEILALANEPCFTPPCEGGASPATRNAAVTDMFEPGSTFKVVTAAAALEEGVMSPETLLDAENGKFRVAGQTIHDHDPFDELTFTGAVVHSSNIAMAKVALELGEDRLYRYCKDFGFGSETGVPLPGEAAGVVRHPSKWSARSTATIAFGQEVSSTALQVTMAYAAVANEGVLLRPILVLSAKGPDGATISRAQTVPVRRVISRETARTLSRILAQVVSEGTGSEANLPWATVAGKTGTAEKYDPKTGTYSTKNYIASFVGYLPAEDPKVVCLVVIDEPNVGSIYGGSVAAPLFREIMEAAAQSYGFPVRPEFRKVASWATQTGRPANAQTAVAHRPSIVEAVQDFETTAAGKISDHRGDSGHDVVPGQMPAVVGLSLRDALQKLASAGVDLSRVNVSGQGIVKSQSPAPGAVIEGGVEPKILCEWL